MGETHNFVKYVHFNPCTESEYPINGQLKLIMIGRKKYSRIVFCPIIIEWRHLFVALCLLHSNLMLTFILM